MGILTIKYNILTNNNYNRECRFFLFIGQPDALPLNVYFTSLVVLVFFAG